MAHKIGLLVSDFDDTLSASDTISVLFDAAVEAKRLSQGTTPLLQCPVVLVISCKYFLDVYLP